MEIGSKWTKLGVNDQEYILMIWFSILIYQYDVMVEYANLMEIEIRN